MSETINREFSDILAEFEPLSDTFQDGTSPEFPIAARQTTPTEFPTSLPNQLEADKVQSLEDLLNTSNQLSMLKQRLTDALTGVAHYTAIGRESMTAAKDLDFEDRRHVPHREQVMHAAGVAALCGLSHIATKKSAECAKEATELITDLQYHAAQLTLNVFASSCTQPSIPAPSQTNAPAAMSLDAVDVGRSAPTPTTVDVGRREPTATTAAVFGKAFDDAWSRFQNADGPLSPPTLSSTAPSFRVRRQNSLLSLTADRLPDKATPMRECMEVALLDLQQKAKELEMELLREQDISRLVASALDATKQLAVGL